MTQECKSHSNPAAATSFPLQASCYVAQFAECRVHGQFSHTCEPLLGDVHAHILLAWCDQEARLGVSACIPCRCVWLVCGAKCTDFVIS